MPAEYILTKDAPAPLPIYSQAVRAGNYVYTSGSVGMTKDMKMVEGTVQDRTRQVIQVSQWSQVYLRIRLSLKVTPAYQQNLEAVLKGAGMTLANVVKANIYLSNLSRDFNAINEVYAEMMPDPKPARTCVGVAQLPAGGTDVEIEFVAYDG